MTNISTINPFYSAKATSEALAKMQDFREAYKVLDDLITNAANGVVIAGGRELALAKTNLEQSSMWAIKSLSHYNVAPESPSATPSPATCPVDPAELSQCDSCQ